MATRLRRFGGVSALRLRVRTSVRLRVREPFRGGVVLPFVCLLVPSGTVFESWRWRFSLAGVFADVEGS